MLSTFQSERNYGKMLGTLGSKIRKVNSWLVDLSKVQVSLGLILWSLEKNKETIPKIVIYYDRKQAASPFIYPSIWAYEHLASLKLLVHFALLHHQLIDWVGPQKTMPFGKSREQELFFRSLKWWSTVEASEILWTTWVCLNPHCLRSRAFKFQKHPSGSFGWLAGLLSSVGLKLLDQWRMYQQKHSYTKKVWHKHTTSWPLHLPYHTL